MRLFLLSGFALLLPALAPSPARASGAAAPFVASRDAGSFERALECLTQAVYYEARGESADGQRAVAQVVLNRVRHPAYPNSVCGVVFQGSQRSTGCQFSFTCTGVMGPVTEPAAWERARRIAAAALGGSVYRPVGLATNFHTTAIRPYWAPSLVPQVVVGAHIFYRRPDSGRVEAFSQAPAEIEPDAHGRSPYEDLRPEPGQSVRPARERRVPGRDRYLPIRIAEIPVAERRLVYRTYGPRPAVAPAAAPAPRQPASRPAAPRSGPSVTVRGGVRIVRGGGP